MKRINYTARTLEFLRNSGWQVQVVERFNPFCKRRVDLFGIIDIVGLREQRILGVQSTSYQCRKGHLDKICIEESDSTRTWLEAGAELWLLTWKKVKVKRGGTAFRYEPVLDIIDAHFIQAYLTDSPLDLCEQVQVQIDSDLPPGLSVDTVAAEMESPVSAKRR